MANTMDRELSPKEDFSIVSAERSSKPMTIHQREPHPCRTPSLS